MDCNPCKMESRIECLEKEAMRNQDTHKEFFNRIEGQEKHMAITEERYNQIRTDTTEIKEQIRTLSEKPAKRWESLVGAVIGALVAGIIAFMLTKVGIK